MKTKKHISIVTAINVFLLFAGSFLITNCDEYRVSPEIPAPNPPVSPALPLILNGYVKDALNQTAISGALVKIMKTDGTVITTLLSNNLGRYAFDASNITENAVDVSATKEGYAFAVRLASIYKESNSAIVSDILLTKLKTVTSTITVAAGGNVSTTNTQSIANQPLMVQVPANSVSSDVQLTLSSIPAGHVPLPTTQNTYILSVGQFGPSGTQFSNPVTITFPLPYRQTPGTIYPLWQLNEQTGVYTNSGFFAIVNVDGTSARATQVTHFSTYVLQSPQSAEVTISLNAPSISVANEFFERLPSGSLSKQLTIVNDVSLSGDGEAEELWLKGQISAKLKFTIGNSEQTLTFSYKVLPAQYNKNGTQVGPEGHENEKGNWEFRTFYVLESSRITGTAAGPNWTRAITAVSQIWKIVHEGWYWILHDQGGVFFGPF